MPDTAIATFNTVEHGSAEVFRTKRGKYSLFVRNDKPVISNLSAEDMMRVIASYVVYK